MNVKGYFMQVQPLSVNDGDGIRTTIFMSGCPLRCRWCSNPEGFDKKTLVGWYQRKCIGCAECVKICPENIEINMNLQREKCVACGKCVAVCQKGARAFFVYQEDADEIINQVHKHRLFYQYSGGGITFSGGEATSQPEILNYFADRLYDMGYSLDIETCGYFDFDKVKNALFKMDLIFMDLKHMNDDKHKKYTGVSNKIILGNMKRLEELPGRVVVRIPIIGGFNDDDGNIRNSARFVHENLPKATMELLPYHKFGTAKYEAIGIPYNGKEFYRLDKDEMEKLTGIIRDEGVEIEDFK